MLHRKRIGSVDLDTGEIVDGQMVLVTPKRKMSFYGGWVVLAQEPLTKIATSNIGASAEAMRVLIMLMAKLDFENLLLINQSSLARELGMKQPAVSRAIKRLVNEGVLVTGPKAGVHKCYRLNPFYGWKGSANSHSKAIKERMKDVGIRIVK